MINADVINGAIRDANEAIEKSDKRIGKLQSQITEIRNAISDLEAQISLKKGELEEALSEIRLHVGAQNMNRGTILTLQGILNGSIKIG